MITPQMEALREIMWAYAKTGFYNGTEKSARAAYSSSARQVYRPTGSVLIFTRDIGHHTSGWWKNPDYERCWHLSVSFQDLEQHTYRAFDPVLAESWARCFYRDWARFIWEESQPLSRRLDMPFEVRHYRVFCDPAWEPIIPRGEVYTRDFTEAGWKSWGDVRYAEAQAIHPKGVSDE